MVSILFLLLSPDRAKEESQKTKIPGSLSSLI